MSKASNRLFVLALLATALCTTACAQPSAARATSGFTRAVQKANGSGIDVRYRLEGESAAGKPRKVQIELTGVTDPTGASVRFSADPGLKLDRPVSTVTSLPAGKTTSLTLTVVPEADGLAYLNVFTSQHGVTGSTSIALQTGPESVDAAQKAPKLKETPAGDKVLSMPVR